MMLRVYARTLENVEVEGLTSLNLTANSILGRDAYAWRPSVRSCTTYYLRPPTSAKYHHRMSAPTGIDLQPDASCVCCEKNHGSSGVFLVACERCPRTCACHHSKSPQRPASIITISCSDTSPISQYARCCPCPKLSSPIPSRLTCFRTGTAMWAALVLGCVRRTMRVLKGY